MCCIFTAMIRCISSVLELARLCLFGEFFAGDGALQEIAQARSESLTFMANGVVSKDAYAYGVLRCVANEVYSKKPDYNLKQVY